MSDPNNWTAIAFLLALLIFACGCWLLHRKLRNLQSVILLCSIAALVAWLPVSSLVTSFVLFHTNTDNPSQLSNWFFISSEFLVPSALILLVASTFLLTVRSIAPQPNNSFKPTPLRGAA
jgi:hypothetical protein